MFADLIPRLRDAMPELRGELQTNVPLAPWTWFKTGGPAQCVYVAPDVEDLAYFLGNLDPDISIFVLGLGSNILVRDGGIEGVVISFGPSFHKIVIEGDTISAGAAVADVKLASAAAMAGLGGFAFLRGIPGTIGGALRMNAGAFGGTIADILVSCEGLDRRGALHHFTPEEMGFSYRHCAVEGIIFTQGLFAGWPENPEKIREDMGKIAQERAKTQPVNTRTGGSTFKNPNGAKAWELIDRAGCRGLTLGDAQVSELHCNFLVNRGKASAADIENLGEMVRQKVLAETGVELEWEILRVGRPPVAHKTSR
ncbi:UDP-N-acetylmuramate dehydrogenase [Beijerinckia indica]|uniref:UDP-N-acetylenolpyruvoylglucosamine reductase n=1 Tax=Beijerinckia indica subsp. indica (strain ATCC 9039 / DSM 1715 / NCIMB 8712) TaxID=395963 RepID=MURB_BEII9|nr:UDP-N-acetylmuramate dehydrogenase [Beijerinckia indica]B2IGG2.1 RecName: Full=UDP-N-acetylenolpyruvoylglucosamine reductase; AltName: Full=UDP-N-acetylmuramate dehydrogenase [Beijerinckia indica subsp. indica ATCC 9039]ACB94344.1 UDP-N-acetylenolpyruvoylglucosamine reductase [Beijerinckia indica subsp. indica ATCC 9039]